MCTRFATGTQVKVKKERLTGKAAAPAGALAATAGMGKGTQLALELKVMRAWPVAKRVEFFARTGVNWAELKKRLTEKRMAPNDDESTGLLKDLRAVYDRVAYRRT